MGVGDDVGEELGGLLACRRTLVDLERRTRSPGCPSVAAVASATTAAIWLRISASAKHDVGDGPAARRVEGDALQPPAAGGEGEQDRGDEEEQPGQAATHRGESGKDRPTRRIGGAAAGVR